MYKLVQTNDKLAIEDSPNIIEVTMDENATIEIKRIAGNGTCQAMKVLTEMCTLVAQTHANDGHFNIAERRLALFQFITKVFT